LWRNRRAREQRPCGQHGVRYALGLESARWRARDGEREMESGRCRRVDNIACDTRWAWRARDGEWSLPVVTAFESASGDCTAKRAANDIGGIGGIIGRAREQMDSDDVHRTGRTMTCTAPVERQRWTGISKAGSILYPFLADDGGEVIDDEYLLAPRPMEESDLPV